jgi:hypothetical protein
MIKVKEPWIIKNFFPEKKYKKIISDINNIKRDSWQFEEMHNRYIYLSEYFSRLSLLELNRARREFESDTLLYTYSLLSLYNQKKSKLDRHKDTNACTYTFDICLYSKNPWPIEVEGKEYILRENEALCFYGEDQYHSRPEFDPENKVLMLFMHWAEPSHIFFKDYGIN